MSNGEDKEEEIREEALKKQQEKSGLEQTVASSFRGGMELKKGEKRRFLGEFRERVLVALTINQVEESGTYPQVLDVIRDERAKRLIIDQRVDMDAAREYIELARENDLSFKKVSSPDFVGEVGLVVVSDRAVNEDEIFAKGREEYLKDEGIPEELIRAEGEKLCGDCYQMIKDKVPGEANNYGQLSWFDKLFGEQCPGPHQ